MSQFFPQLHAVSWSWSKSFCCLLLYPNPSWISSRGRRLIYNHFIDYFPIRTSIFPGGISQAAMFDYRMVLYLKPPLSTIGNGLCLSPWHLAKQIQTSDDARLAVVTLWNPSWPKNIHHLHRLESIYIHVCMYNYICVCIDIFLLNQSILLSFTVGILFITMFDQRYLTIPGCLGRQWQGVASCGTRGATPGRLSSHAVLWLFQTSRIYIYILYIWYVYLLEMGWYDVTIKTWKGLSWCSRPMLDASAIYNNRLKLPSPGLHTVQHMTSWQFM